MTVVLDANVLLRFFDPTSAQHVTAVTALSALRTRGHAPRTLPQYRVRRPGPPAASL
jgi:hypothetical protein